MTRIYGFSLLRNGVKYDYPFRESLASLLGLTEGVWLALGKSEDGTEEEVARMSGLHVKPTIWDENLRQEGVILSQQTNLALAFLRESHPSGWGFYLQADEVLLESEFNQIHRDLEQAEHEGCDAVSFRYLHFWQSYDRLAYARRWYPEEVRAIRLDSPIESYSDAQGFRHHRKIFHSNCHIYHYGHVREATAYERKKSDFHRWWHTDEEMRKRISAAKASDAEEPTLAWHGPHPNCMNERRGAPPRLPRRSVLVYGEHTDLPRGFWARVNADLSFTLDVDRVSSHDPADVVLLRNLPLWRRLFSRPPVPRGMLWKGSRPWE
ncbi:MAG: hypothetical protein HUU37_11255, partial [Bdellovibrionales bacterium]|nr:hypothetical protein [Bdellovibrionales bacterium]